MMKQANKQKMQYCFLYLEVAMSVIGSRGLENQVDEVKRHTWVTRHEVLINQLGFYYNKHIDDLK